MARTKSKKGTSRISKDSVSVDELVLGTVNASYKREITASALEACLRSAELGDWPVHIASFFTEVSPNLVFSFAALHGISKSELARAYSTMKSKTGEFNPDLESELVPVATVA